MEYVMLGRTLTERSDLRQDEYAEPVTNWVLVSNLGLAAYKGSDGLAVNVRSLADGKPLPGIAVRLRQASPSHSDAD